MLDISGRVLDQQESGITLDDAPGHRRGEIFWCFYASAAGFKLATVGYYWYRTEVGDDRTHSQYKLEPSDWMTYLFGPMGILVFLTHGVRRKWSSESI